MTVDTGATPWLPRVERWMPGIRAMRTYDRSWLSRDLIAGVVLVTLLVPQGMAYAELAGLPAIAGLYTTVMCLVAYAIVGPSPILVLGPDSSLGPMIAATVLPLAAGDPDQAIALAGMLAIIVGAITVGAGLKESRPCGSRTATTSTRSSRRGDPAIANAISGTCACSTTPGPGPAP
jgi:DMSO reductase anchor subunit